MFKTKRNPAVSTESGAYDYGDALPSAGHRDSSEDEGDQSKGRSVTRRLTDEVRKLSMTMIDPGVRGQRSCKVQMEVDLHHVSLISAVWTAEESVLGSSGVELATASC